MLTTATGGAAGVGLKLLAWARAPVSVIGVSRLMRQHAPILDRCHITQQSDQSPVMPVLTPSAMRQPVVVLNAYAQPVCDPLRCAMYRRY